MGATKLAAEYLCHKYSKNAKLKISIVRFGNVFNSNGSVSEIFRYELMNGGKIKISHPKVERFFMSGEEASNLITSALEIISTNQNQNKCRTFICNMEEPIQIIDLANKMIFLSGRSNKKYLSKNFYGLKNIEKISEKLISKDEKVINIFNKRIFEIKNNKLIKKFYKTNFKKLTEKYSDKHNKLFLKNMFRN